MQFYCGKKKNRRIREEKCVVGPLLHFPRTSRHAIFCHLLADRYIRWRSCVGGMHCDNRNWINAPGCSEVAPSSCTPHACLLNPFGCAIRPWPSSVQIKWILGQCNFFKLIFFVNIFGGLCNLCPTDSRASSLIKKTFPQDCVYPFLSVLFRNWLNCELT